MDHDDPFDWDPEKDRSNYLKHGIWFQDAKGVFDDNWVIEAPDHTHSWDEDRWIAIGRIATWRIIMLVYVLRGSKIRIISARDATAWERRTYEKRERR